MDRLICGDVGYGKTEVALRAAFKAAADGKQVMFLVPTTVLAQQHYGTFTERLRDYPFTIEMVSRFRSAKETREALKGFEEGKVDILIGTHRLLSRDVRPKDLGLLIVDEEQRFGVKQKELLRQLRLRVDVLSLTRHADPAHAADVAGRPARHLGDRDPAGGPPPGEDLRGRLRRGAGASRRSSASWSAAARRSSCTTAWRRSRRPPSACGRWCPKARVAGGPRPDGREAAREDDARLPARRGRRAGVHHDHRVGPRHRQRQHADRGARRRARAGAALPDPGPGGPLARARLRLPALPLARPRSPRTPRRACRRSPTTPSWARASRSPCATSRSAAPATCWATSSPATWRRWASSSTWRMLDEAVAALAGRLRRRGARAGAHGPAGGRLRARRLRALRGGEDRGPPPRRRAPRRSPT